MDEYGLYGPEMGSGQGLMHDDEARNSLYIIFQIRCDETAARNIWAYRVAMQMNVAENVRFYFSMKQTQVPSKASI